MKKTIVGLLALSLCAATAFGAQIDPRFVTGVVKSTEKGAVNGVAELGADQILKSSQRPTTDGITEGSTNLYFTNGRAQGAVSASAPLGYAGGVFSLPKATALADGYLDKGDFATFSAKLSAIPRSNTIFVDKAGNDGTCVAGESSKPCLTVAQAMSLVAAPASGNRFLIKVGVGTFVETTLTLKPWTWIEGSGGQQAGGSSRINVSSNAITLDAGWSAGSLRGGLSNIYLTGSTGFTADFQALSATASHTIEIFNVGMNGALTFKANSGTLDFIDVFGSRVFGNVAISGGAVSINEALLMGNVTIDNAGTQNVDGDIYHTAIGGNVAVNQSGASTLAFRLGNALVSGTVSKSGTPTFTTNLSAYLPGTPGNWTTQPVSVNDALDKLAARAYEPVITAGLATQYWGGDKAWHLLDTSAVPENGNLYFTSARAKAAAVIDSLAGSETDMAPSVASVKAAIAAVPTATAHKESITLAGADITAQYVDMSIQCKASSLVLGLKGAGLLNESDDYSVSVVGGKTRISFAGDIATAGATPAVAGDKLYAECLQ